MSPLRIAHALIKARPSIVRHMGPRTKALLNAKATDYVRKRKQQKLHEQDVQAAVQAALAKAKQEVVTSHAYNQPELQAALTRALSDYLTQIAAGQVHDTAASFAFGFDPLAVDKVVRDWAARYTYDQVTGINSKTLEAVRDAVTKFTSTPGMTNAGLEALLEPAFGEVRAEMIAITEVTRAYAQGEHIFQNFMAEQGIQTVREWITSEDEAVCPICGALNKQQVGPDEPFMLEGVAYDDPPAHPRCRCDTMTRLA